MNAYKIAALVPGSLALILSDHLPWTTVFIVTAAFMLPGMVMTLVVREPEVHGAPPKNLREAIVEPFREFIMRDGWRGALLVLGFIFLYKLGDTMATTLSTSFFLDIGFNKHADRRDREDGRVLGEPRGRDRRRRVADEDRHRRAGCGFSASLQMVVDARFRVAREARAVARSALGARVLRLRDLRTGSTTAAFIAYIASTTDPRYTATQFALFTSLASVPRTLASASSGFMVAQTGWFEYFMICTALSIPGMLLLPRIAPWRAQR